MIYKVVGSNHPEINKVSFRAVWKRSLIWFSFVFFSFGSVLCVICDCCDCVSIFTIVHFKSERYSLLVVAD